MKEAVRVLTVIWSRGISSAPARNIEGEGTFLLALIDERIAPSSSSSIVSLTPRRRSPLTTDGLRRPYVAVLHSPLATYTWSRTRYIDRGARTATDRPVRRLARARACVQAKLGEVVWLTR
eukprot:scaffold4934_cov128-Isochrysis_galbana.AAC.7